MKKQILANLNSIERAKTFAAAVSLLTCEVDVCSGRYVVDGKSLLGLFSLNLSEPVQVVAYGTEEELEAFDQKIAPFVTEEEQSADGK